jgi:very-short-patch-repair endonuclease
LGPYVLDFFCDAAGLAIEVDGAVHGMGDRPGRDEARNGWCAERGIKTLRIRAIDIKEELDAVINLILAQCQERAPSTATRSPSPGNPGAEKL